jgi:hypothetical protein
MFLSLDSESLMIKKVTITIGNTDIGSTSVENKVLIVLSAKGSELENLKPERISKSGKINKYEVNINNAADSRPAAVTFIL